MRHHRFAMLMKNAICLTALLSMTAAIHAQPTELNLDMGGFFNNPDTIWVPQIFMGGKAGTERSIGQVDLMIPFTPTDPRMMIFGDVRLRADTDDSLECNLGGGMRYQWDDTKIIGVYGYYDLLRSEYDFNYSQFTFGAELLLERWRFRGNGYIPEDKVNTIDSLGGDSVSIIGNRLAILSTALQEHPLPGFDLEVGYKPFKRLELWVYGGYYHFEDFGNSQWDAINGPRLRAEWQISTDSFVPGSYLGLNAEYQHDSVTKDEGFFGVTWRIPLGGSTSVRQANEKALDWRNWAMMSQVMRDVDIKTGVQKQQVDRPAVNPETGEAYSGIYWTQADANGSGTASDPTSLEKAVQLAGQNGVVVINGTYDSNNNVIKLETEGVVLVSGMTVIGAGGTLNVATVLGKTSSDAGQTVMSIELAGNAPTIRGVDTAETIFTLADGASNVLITNMYLLGSSVAVIKGQNNENVRIEAFSIKENTGAAISLADVKDLSILNATIDSDDGSGILVTGLSGETNISDLSITTDDQALSLTGNGSSGDKLDIDGVSITTTHGSGMTITDAGQVTISDLDVDATGGAALSVSNSDLDATITSLSSTDSSDYGVYLSNVTGTLTVSGATTIDKTTGQGMYVGGITDDSTKLTFSTVAITDAGTDGLVIDQNAGTTTISAGSISAKGGAALSISDADVAITLSSLTSSNSTDGGVVLDGMSGTLSVSGAVTVDESTGNGVTVENITDDDTQITFGSIAITDAGATGIYFNNLAGAFTVSGTTAVEDVAETGIEITNLASTAKLTFGATSVTNADGDAGLSIHDTAGKIILGATTITDTAGMGVAIENITTDKTALSFGDLTVTKATDTGLLITGVDADDLTIAFEDASISTASSSTADAVVITDNNTTTGDLTISFNSLSTNAAEGTGLLLADNNMATLEIISGGNIIADGGPAIDATDTNFDATLTSITSTNSTSAGVILDGISGSFEVTGTTSIDGATDYGILLSNLNTAGTTITFGTTEVVGTGDIGILISDTTAANLAVTFGATTIDDVDGDGIRLENISGNSSVLTFGNTAISSTSGAGFVTDNITSNRFRLTTGTLDISDTDDQGLLLTGITASNAKVTLGDITTDSTGGAGVEVSDIAAAVNFSDVDVTQTSSNADGVLISANTGKVTFGDVTVDRADGNGVLITNAQNDVEFDSISTTRADEAGVVVQNINTSFVLIDLGDVTADNSDNQGLLITNITGEGVNIDADSVTVDGAGAEGVLVTDISGADVDIDLGDINATNTQGDAVSITNILASASNFQLNLGSVTSDDSSGSALSITNILASNTSFDVESLTATNPALNAIVIDTITGTDGLVSIGAINLTDITDTGLLIQNINVSGDFDVTLSSVTLNQPDTNADIADILNNSSTSGTVTVHFGTLTVWDDPDTNAAVNQSGNTNTTVQAGTVHYKTSD